MASALESLNIVVPGSKVLGRQTKYQEEQNLGREFLEAVFREGEFSERDREGIFRGGEFLERGSF